MKMSKKIKDFYNENKRVPKKRDIISYNTALKLFGTWNNAIRGSGLEVTTNFNKEDVKKILFRKYKELKNIAKMT